MAETSPRCLIGKVKTKAMDLGPWKMPAEEIPVVEIVEAKDKKYYISNRWYKSRIPLVIHEDLVEKYEPA